MSQQPPPMARSVTAPPPPPPGVPLRPVSPGGAVEYQSPGSPGVATYRSGSILFTHNDAVLPEFCVKCGGNEGLVMKTKKFVWSPSWVYITILISILITLILVLVLQKKATITFGTCAKCRARKMMFVWIFLASLALAAVSVMAAIAMDAPVLILPAVVLFLGGLICLAVGLPVLRPRKIEANGRAEFTGCGEAFLGTLSQV